jgi:hypothetical protein
MTMWLKNRFEQANLEGTGGGAPSPTPTPSPTPSPSPAANDAWFPEAHKGLVETKGWKTPGDSLDSYANLEKLIGADRAGRTVVMPKDENDVEGKKAFYAKLGVPESADKYELPLPEGDDGSLAKVAADWFHQAGVPKTAAQSITKAWNEHIGGLVKAQEEAAKAKSDADLAQLKQTWGADAQKNEEFSRRGMKAFGTKAGLDENDLNTLESSLGTAKMLNLFLTLGKSTTEPGFAGEGGGGGFSMTKSAAQSKLAEIQARRAAGTITDIEWKNGQQAEFERLSQFIHSAP